MSNEENDRKSTGSSRLGKEAKIGVTVIAVLLIAFGVVAAMRQSTDDRAGQGRAGQAVEDHDGRSEPMETCFRPG